MEQPNITSDGEAALTRVFWIMVVLTGVAVGLFGMPAKWHHVGLKRRDERRRMISASPFAGADSGRTRSPKFLPMREQLPSAA
jgi:hypothetical protein